MYLRGNPPFEPEDVTLHSLRVRGMVRRADRHPTLACVPGGAHARGVGRTIGGSGLKLRQLAYLLDASLQCQPQPGGHEALQQFLHEDKRDFQIVTPPAVSIRAFKRAVGTPRREIYMRELRWHRPARADGATTERKFVNNPHHSICVSNGIDY